MKTLQTHKNRWEINEELGTEDLKLYFRIPFTMYFVGRVFYYPEWSKLYLFRKEWGRDNYYIEKV